ncbi:Na+/H+ antiporter subunit E [Pseudobdellovibrio exovorus]|nr:Na+/H+ antiporter subunit E [Pseudobdellovibrio exovorus]
MRIVLLIGYFLKEVFVANVQIAKLVFKKPKYIHPAIIKVPLDIKTERGLLLLSSMITLTPGTLSLDISSDRKHLYVHVTHTTSPEVVVAQIKSGFERKLMEVGC